MSTPPPTADPAARALASPLRLRILRMCLDTALTNAQIATRLHLQPATTYHHVKVLEATGMLRAEPARRGRRGAREIPYRATGRSWDTPAGPWAERVLVEAFLSEFAEAAPGQAQIARLGLRLDSRGQAEFTERMWDLLREFRYREPTSDGQPLSVFVVIHPDPTRN